MTVAGGHVVRRAGQAQADAITAQLEATDPDLLRALEVDPLRALQRHPDLVLTNVPEWQTDAGCSVAGAYISDGTPAVLAVAAAASAGRRQFTVLHEFAHHLQQTETTLMGALLDQADQGVTLEEAACDAFAAGVLLPRRRVSEHIGPNGPTADSVVSLWSGSRASRAAVCVRAAQTLPSTGHVLLLDGDGRVQFDAAHGLPPVRRGSSQAQVPLIAQALRTSHRAEGTVALAYRDGILGAELHAQVADLGGFVVVVAVTDRAPWQRLSLPAAASGTTASTWTCEHCDHEFSTSASRCDRCQKARCPECARCPCPPIVPEQTCISCFQRLPVRSFEDDSTTCTSCA